MPGARVAAELLAFEAVPQVVVACAAGGLVTGGVAAAAGAGAFGDVHDDVAVQEQQRLAERCVEVGGGELGGRPLPVRSPTCRTRCSASGSSTTTWFDRTRRRRRRRGARAGRRAGRRWSRPCRLMTSGWAVWWSARRHVSSGAGSVVMWTRPSASERRPGDPDGSTAAGSSPAPGRRSGRPSESNGRGSAVTSGGRNACRSASAARSRRRRVRRCPARRARVSAAWDRLRGAGQQPARVRLRRRRRAWRG